MAAGCAGRQEIAPGAGDVAASGPVTDMPGDAARIAPPAVASMQPVNPRAELTIDQIVPDAAAIVSAEPTTQPATQPSLDALEAYARGRGAMHRRDDAYAATNFLERAAKLDPASAPVQYALGQSLAQVGQIEKAAAAMQRASALKPGWLQPRLDVARLYARFAPEKSMRELILASKTPDYASDEADAATVDFLLARVLQQQGYERAAVEQYEKLLWRLSRKSLAIRGNPDLSALAARPEPLQMELARLYERRGRYGQAVALYQRVAEKSPQVLEPQARLVRAQLNAGDADGARSRAAELVKRFGASPPSIDLLREVHRESGDEAGALVELRRLHAEDPADRNVLLALAEVLTDTGQPAEAEALIEAAAQRPGPNVDLLRRLVAMRAARGDTEGAARVIVEATARRPAAAAEMAPLWRPLLRPWSAAWLRPDVLRRVAVSAGAEAARLYWVSRLAREQNRFALSEQALEQATALDPVFPPAFMLRAQQIWAEPESGATDERVPAEAAERRARRERATADLARRARDAGNEALALTVEAIAASASRPPPDDLPLYEAAAAAGAGAWPEFHLARAAALQRATQTQKYEQALWKLVSDFPFCDEAYRALLAHYGQKADGGALLKVARTWLSADPQSIPARVIQARLLVELRQPDAAESMLRDALREDPEEPDVLSALVDLFTRGERPGQAVEFLQRELAQNPRNAAAAELLAGLHVTRGETPAALQVIEALAAAAEAASSPARGGASGAGDANLLYYAAQLFYRFDEKQRAEAAMERALAADPGHVPSSNDLAYFWAEAGTRLDRAEALARQAVTAEPDNAAYLDTLGWALYKQGRFDEAVRYLEQSVSVAVPIDAVLLDHLGDAYYRLGRADDAVRRWQDAAERLRRQERRRGGEDEDSARLRLALEVKLRQAEVGEPVEVSPAGPAPADARRGE